MQRRFLLLTIFILASLMAGCAASVNAQAAETAAIETGVSTELPETSNSETLSEDAKVECPVTGPQDPPFAAPPPYSPDSRFPSNFWYGSSSLWTDLPKDGGWYGLPHNPEGYTQKIFWWREGYIWKEEPEPDLTVTGERLDAPAPPLIASRATNAYASDIGSAMLVGVDFPTLGCWKITGKYADTELSFVVWIGP